MLCAAFFFLLVLFCSLVDCTTYLFFFFSFSFFFPPGRPSRELHCRVHRCLWVWRCLSQSSHFSRRVSVHFQRGNPRALRLSSAFPSFLFLSFLVFLFPVSFVWLLLFGYFCLFVCIFFLF